MTSSPAGGLGDGTKSAPLVRIRCRQCQAINDEAAKYCDQCGTRL